MSLAGLLPVVADDPELRAARELAATPGLDGGDLVATPELRPLLVASLAQGGSPGPGNERFVLAVTATAREAEDLAATVNGLLPAHSAAYFPAWETLPHERLSPRPETSGQRLAVLRRLAHPDPGPGPNGPIRALAAPIRALLQPLVGGLGELAPVELAPGQRAALDQIVASLVEIGYTRVELVTRRGELAVRGGLLDVFPPTEEHPVRVEFFGDEVEDMRSFKASDQRSLGPASRLWAPPCRELLLTPEVRSTARQLVAEWPSLTDILGKLADGITVEGMEALAPALVGRMELLLDCLPPGALIMACDPERIRARAADLVATSQEFLEASWVNAAVGANGPVDLSGAAFRSITEIRRSATRLGQAWWVLSPFLSDPTLRTADAINSPPRLGAGAVDPTTRAVLPPMQPDADDAESDGRTSFSIEANPARTYRGNTAAVVGDVAGWVGAGWRVVLVTQGHGPAQRLAELLRGEGLAARAGDLDGAPEPGVIRVATGRLDRGFSWPAVRLAVLAEADLSGQLPTGETRRMPSRRRAGIDPLRLVPGDYVVHEQHGVGRYVELTSRTVAGATREYVVIEYAPSRRGHPPDRLYLPTDQLDLLTRYSGGEAPTLHRLGGADWAKAKGRARQAVRDIAAGLIQLYQARMASPGHAFGADTPWQRELEDAFPYVETPDQLAAVNEVKADMERPVPMDRLICGDVGYGKTEIAVRAAFKAVQDGQQVAVLVPTTLLAAQHHATFSDRYAPFPVVVRPLSRFSSDAEAAATLEGLAEGKVDVVIGTHKLLSPEVRFARLGLVIVDEEQRFGVEHKEYLKRLRTQVDVLAMSATPIPRTLEMGISGIREMSTILTPPEERHPVLTSIGPYDEKQITAAIRRELLRDGQVFFVHNRVSSIGRVAARVASLVPEARVAVGHGQMNEHVLERTMAAFVNRESDVLVSTTIVESGLDIPNANTLIVDRADMYGLPDLYQLRGRVGRGRERGYAYFLFPPEKPLSETAYERLATIAQHNEFGAGLQIALKDLELRGAGNLLGGEQSGHIAAVGFDLYVKMIGEAVRELRGDGGADLAERSEVRIELPVDAHIPHWYVDGERLRLEAYTRISAIDSSADIAAVREELVDRYGTPPPQVETLLAVARLRVAARRAGLSDIAVAGNHVRFAPVSLPDSVQVRVARLYPRTVLKRATNTMLVPAPRDVSASSPGALGGPPLRDARLLVWCEDLLGAVFGGPEHE